jgi:hypothetical protein
MGNLELEIFVMKILANSYFSGAGLCDQGLSDAGLTVEMQRVLLRRACARVTETLAVVRDLPAGELLAVRLGMNEVLGMVSRGPMLALPWRGEERRVLDGKMRASGERAEENFEH